MKKLVMIFFILLQVSCSETNEMRLTLKDSSVDFSEVVEGDWNRVCFLGLYSNNIAARSLLGFGWDADNLSRISDLDNITLLLFANDDGVIKYSELSREIDFSLFSNTYIKLTEAKFNIGVNDVVNVGRQK
ncbi:hypothetical protein [Vibrio harveyi]|uniref:hypothetical protein n=1 Tax=Vibrio harveyi TaxID=669 RepID=UPI002380A5DD|nr:hypothetical protein [Vibrio harveyi]EMB9230199.1 hypothetical protein [Vibrio harveyi]HDM8061635.1 hypothetical protein [Vibrio harveyi]